MRDTRAEEAKRPNIEGEVKDGGVIISEWRDAWANPESRIQSDQVSREKPKTEGRSQRPSVHAKHPGIVGEAAEA